ncbi:MAG TPA: hypothetical protein VJ994_00380 [Paracoccaceae bacterium]|nr:hypothetical protein [Paracoccaceae bacterium]
MTVSPEGGPAEARRKAAERRIAFLVFVATFLAVLALELLAGREPGLLLAVFNLVVASVVTFVVWLVRDTLHDRARRRAGAAERKDTPDA